MLKNNYLVIPTVIFTESKDWRVDVDRKINLTMFPRSSVNNTQSK